MSFARTSSFRVMCPTRASDMLVRRVPDDYPGAGIGVKYLLNRYVSANLNYNYSERSANVPSVNFTDDMISLGLTFHI